MYRIRLTAVEEASIGLLPDTINFTLAEKVRWANILLQHLGFDDPLELFRAQLDVLPDKMNHRKEEEQRVKRLFTCGNVHRFVTTVLTHRFSNTPIVLKQVTDDSEFMRAVGISVAHKFGRELDEYRRFTSKEASSYTPDDIEKFDLTDIQRLANDHAPYLFSLLREVGEFRRRKLTDKNSENPRNKVQIVALALSLISNARSKKSNLFQGHLGYALYSYHTGKRVLCILNALGVTVGCDSINNISMSVGDKCVKDLKKATETSRPVLNFDNCEYNLRVKIDSISKSDEMRSDTVGYVYFPEGVDSKLDFVAEKEVKTSEAENVTPVDILPTEANMDFIADASVTHIYNIIDKYHGPAMSKYRETGGWKRPEIPALRELPLTKTPIFPLPALPLNEGKTDEILQVADIYLGLMGVDGNKMNNKVMLSKGDLGTVATLEGGKTQRKDCDNKADRLDFLQCKPSLFHMEYAMEKLLSDVHWGSERDPCGIGRFVNMTKNNKVKRDGKDFRSSTCFQSDVLDGLTLAAVYKTAGVSGEEEFENLLKRRAKDVDVVKICRDVAETTFDHAKFRALRTNASGNDKEPGHPDRDIPNEGGILCMRDFLIMREYREAVRKADVERIVNVLFVWCAYFNGSGCFNYAKALVDICAGLRKVWDAGFREHFLNSILVNPSGKVGKWMPDDMFCEWIVREFKEIVKNRLFMNGLDLYTRKNLTRQICIMQMNRLRWIRMSGAHDYGQKSTIRARNSDVRLFARTAMAENIFTFISGRHIGHAGGQSYEYSSTKDVFAVGKKAIHLGGPLADYRSRYQRVWDGTIVYVAPLREDMMDEFGQFNDPTLRYSVDLDGEEELDDMLEDPIASLFT